MTNFVSNTALKMIPLTQIQVSFSGRRYRTMGHARRHGRRLRQAFATCWPCDARRVRVGKESEMRLMLEAANRVRQKWVLAVVASAQVVALIFLAQVRAPTAQTSEAKVLPVKVVNNYCKDNCGLDQFEALSAQTVHYLHDPLIRDW